jgi:GTP cyclohydrolase IA
MNAVIRPLSHSSPPNPGRQSEYPSQQDVEAAFRSILHWIGEDPDRDGLRETPARVARAPSKSTFAAMGKTPRRFCRRHSRVVLRGIPFQSHCEHHVAPIIGRAWVAYVPNARVVGISKLARVVEAYAKRLQIQELMTAQVANTIEHVLKPKGIGVVIKATHHCMTTRRINKQGTNLVTSRMLGCFRENPMTRHEFLSMVHSSHEQ